MLFVGLKTELLISDSMITIVHMLGICCNDGHPMAQQRCIHVEADLDFIGCFGEHASMLEGRFDFFHRIRIIEILIFLVAIELLVHRGLH